jgi:type VI secretion system protein ImpL
MYLVSAAWPNGVFDEYFKTNLADKVDMSTRPWSLRQGSGVRTLPGLETFAQAAEIRDAYFASGSGEPSFQVDVRARAIDPAIKEVALTIDGQPLSFSTTAPGPRTLRWPGSGAAHVVRLQFLPAGTAAPIETTGAWALHRLFRRAQIAGTGRPEAFRATFALDGHTAEFEVTAQSVANPLNLPALERFRCPAR